MSATLPEWRRGVYGASRAAALAGIPKTTLYYWRRTGLLQPSISRERVMLWSWVDLVRLRATDWLRTRKGIDLPKIRDVLEMIEEEGLDRQPLSRLVLVSAEGELFVRLHGVPVRSDAGRQIADGDMLDLTAPYDTGPDLVEPRPALRIIPGKLSGEPHVVDTRIDSPTLFALHRSGYDVDAIRRMYPDVSAVAAEQAIELELQLHDLAA